MSSSYLDSLLKSQTMKIHQIFLMIVQPISIINGLSEPVHHYIIYLQVEVPYRAKGFCSNATFHHKAQKN